MYSETSGRELTQEQIARRRELEAAARKREAQKREEWRRAAEARARAAEAGARLARDGERREVLLERQRQREEAERKRLGAVQGSMAPTWAAFMGNRPKTLADRAADRRVDAMLAKHREEREAREERARLRRELEAANKSAVLMAKEFLVERRKNDGYR